jgi:putative Holliday junction resolvase
MPRIIALDYGLKRTGIAVTDPMQIIATGLTTVETLDDSDTHATEPVRKFIARLHKTFPKIPVETADERYTSKMASRAMIDMGMKKKDRRNKYLVDEIAATIMLQDHLENR